MIQIIKMYMGLHVTLSALWIHIVSVLSFLLVCFFLYYIKLCCLWHRLYGRSGFLRIFLLSL